MVAGMTLRSVIRERLKKNVHRLASFACHCPSQKQVVTFKSSNLRVDPLHLTWGPIPWPIRRNKRRRTLPILESGTPIEPSLNEDRRDPLPAPCLHGGLLLLFAGRLGWEQ